VLKAGDGHINKAYLFEYAMATATQIVKADTKFGTGMDANGLARMGPIHMP